MSKTKTYALIVAMLIVATMLFTACGGSSSLIGKWEGVSASVTFMGETETESLESGLFFIEFKDGGTGISYDHEYSNGFTWSTDGDKLTITEDNETDIFTYKVSGSTLTLTIDYGSATSIITLKKVN
jgi:hypothetical protein